MGPWLAGPYAVHRMLGPDWPPPVRFFDQIMRFGSGSRSVSYQLFEASQTLGITHECGTLQPIVIGALVALVGFIPLLAAPHLKKTS